MSASRGEFLLRGARVRFAQVHGAPAGNCRATGIRAFFWVILLKDRRATVYILSASMVCMRDYHRAHTSQFEISGSINARVSVPLYCGKGVMRTARFRQMARPESAAVVLLMLCWAGAPRAARAGCDHIVQSRLDPFHEVNQLDELIVAGASASPDGFSRSPFDRPLPYRSSPCSGISCSSRIPLPVSTASIATDGSQQWCTLAVPFMVESESPGRATRDESRPSSTSEISSIFHPPRV
jgi:hypothetical protein